MAAAAPSDASAPGSTSADDVRNSLRELLPTCDMDVTTERKIRELLSERLGADMEPFKALIKDQIDIWLSASMAQQAAAAAAGGGGGAAADYAAGHGADDYDDDDAFIMPSSADPVGKRKRQQAPAAAAAAAGGERAAKVARSSTGAGGAGAAAAAAAGGGAVEGAPEGGVQLDDEGHKWLSVSTWKGKQRVDMRVFYTASGKLAPTKKGISLSLAEWGVLQGAVPGVSKALAEGDTAFVAELGNNKRATVSHFGGKLQAGVREHYEDKSGEMKPGLKGINLTAEQWTAMVEQLPAFNARVQTAAPAAAAAAAAAAPAAAKPPPPPTPAAAAEAAAAAAAALAAAAEATGSPAAAAAAARAATQEVPDDAPLSGKRDEDGDFIPEKTQNAVQLNAGITWLTSGYYQNQHRVDLRLYDEGGNYGLIRTKKGISLSLAEWGVLQGAVPGVSKALAEGDTTFVAELGSNKRVTVSNACGSMRVGVQQYQPDPKTGQLTPRDAKGDTKGVTLLADEWAVLVAQLPTFNSRLEQQRQDQRETKDAMAARAFERAGGAAAAAAAVEVPLGGKKRAAISHFTGTACVDLRETYEKDGKTLPGKKGIMLTPEQWRTVVDAARDISAALQQRDTAYCLQLSTMRRVSISEFKKVLYVNVREYYQDKKSKELKPSQKGLSMTKEQWQALVDGMASLSAQLA